MKGDLSVNHCWALLLKMLGAWLPYWPSGWVSDKILACILLVWSSEAIRRFESTLQTPRNDSLLPASAEPLSMYHIYACSAQIHACSLSRWATSCLPCWWHTASPAAEPPSHPQGQCSGQDDWQLKFSGSLMTSSGDLPGPIALNVSLMCYVWKYTAAVESLTCLRHISTVWH